MEKSFELTVRRTGTGRVMPIRWLQVSMPDSYASRAGRKTENVALFHLNRERGTGMDADIIAALRVALKDPRLDAELAALEAQARKEGR